MTLPTPDPTVAATNAHTSAQEPSKKAEASTEKKVEPLPPIAPLAYPDLSEELFQSFDKAKKRHQVAYNFDEKNNTATMETGRDLFYEKTLLDFSVALAELKTFRKDLANNSTQTSQQNDLEIEIEKQKPVVSLTLKGRKKDFESGYRISQFFSKTGEPIADAFQKLLELLLIIANNHYIHRQRSKIKKQIKEIRAEFKQLEAYDKKHGTTHLKTAKARFSSEMLALIEGKVGMTQARNNFYAQDEFKDALKNDKDISIKMNVNLTGEELGYVVQAHNGYMRLNDAKFSKRVAADNQEEKKAAKSAGSQKKH